MNNKGQAFAKAIKYLGYKMRTKKEISDYLYKKNFSNMEIDETISKLIDYNLIDDREYARFWISDRFNFFNQGRFKLTGDLLKKGISKEIITEELHSFFTEEKEEEKIRYLIAKKNPGNQILSEKELFLIYKYIVRKGFPAAKVRKILLVESEIGDS